MKLPTWMVEHLQEAADPGVLAYAKWLRNELLTPEEASLLVLRGWISFNDVRRNAGMADLKPTDDVVTDARHYAFHRAAKSSPARSMLSATPTLVGSLRRAGS